MLNFRRPILSIGSAARRRLIMFLGLASLVVFIAGAGKSWMNSGQTAVDVVEASELLGEWDIGEDDFQISQMGTAADFRNVYPDVAYNVNDDQYLVVWAADDSLNGETAISRINGRLFDGSGQPIGADFTIADANQGLDDDHDVAVVYNQMNNKYLVAWGDTMPLTNEREIIGIQVGSDGSPIGGKRALTTHGIPGQTIARTYNPKLVHNTIDNEYLLVYQGDNHAGAAMGEYEIFYVRMDGVTVNSLGSGRISDMGPDGSPGYDALGPDVVFNPINSEYLVAWFGDSDGGDSGVFDNEFEIFTQRLTKTGAEVGPNDFRISDMGPNGDDDFDARSPSISYNSLTNQYLVVWYGDDVIEDENEIYGQLLTASGQQTGSNDFRISYMGPDDDLNYDGILPAVVYNANNNQFMVSWQADDNSNGMVDDELEIFGRAVSAAGQTLGATEVRLSQMGIDGDIVYSGTLPKIAFNTTANEYFVVWQGYDDSEAVMDSQAVVFAQRVDGAAVQEVGEDDAMLSDYQEILTLFRAGTPKVAFNSADNEYLVVWNGDDNADGMVDGEYEVFALRYNAVTGQPIGSRIRLSDMGPTGDPDYDASSPSVAYNSADNEYLVVWSADDNVGGVIVGDKEIFGQRLSADGVEIGTNDFRISDMGPEGVVDYPARTPDVVYNQVDNEYLVVWWGDNTIAGMDYDFEIFGQRLSAAGVQIGVNDFRISDMGPEGVTDFIARDPSVAHSLTNNQYMVVWSGYEIFVGNNLETEIFGQRLNAAGIEIGTNDFRISEMGPDGDSFFRGLNPDVAYNPTNNQFLVIWSGFDDIPQVFGKQIFGQRFDAAGNEIGTDEFLISDAPLNVNKTAEYPSLVVNSVTGDYMVAWHGFDETIGMGFSEFEIFARQVAANGGILGDNDVRLSNMGPDGDNVFDALRPALAVNSLSGEYLVVWNGNEAVSFNFDEIFGQFFVPTDNPPPTPTATVTVSPTPPGPTPTSTPPGQPVPGFEIYLPIVVDGSG